LAAHPEKVAAYKNGRQGLIGFFVGEGMKVVQGQPQAVQAVLRRLLEQA
jgi:Asp-tRNA(Asn)/Glu-tRNA(Gln) amidotransferase B subunit